MEVLQPIPQERVVDAVRARLRSAILEGELRPGSRLSVPELARRLEVSRSPVREAVLGLVAEGLAVEHSRRGAVVAQVAVADLQEIYEVRASLEGYAARLCAARVNASGLAELSGLLSAQRVAVEREDARAYRELDGRFHHLVVNMAGNSRLSKLAGRLVGEIGLAGRMLADGPAHFRLALAEHVAIVDAIGRHDPEGAEGAMRTHLLRVRDAIRQQHPGGTA